MSQFEANLPPTEARNHDDDLTGTQPAAVPNTPTAAPDPFDPASLRLSQEMNAGFGAKKLLTTVPVRKPSKEWFVRCHPDEAYSLETNVIELKEEGETYLVAPPPVGPTRR